MKNICVFCLLCCFFMAAPFTSAGSDQLNSLQQENRLLQQQVKKLEAQVDAMREEMNRPGADRIVSGFGYIAGVFGVAGWVAAGRKKRGER